MLSFFFFSRFTYDSINYIWSSLSREVLMTFLLLLYRWKIASVYHTQNEQNNRKCERGKKKHNNRHMISMLAFLRQDASRYLLLKQLCVCVCVCVCVFEHTHTYYLFDAFQSCPSLIVYRLSASVGILRKKGVMNSLRCEWMLCVKEQLVLFTSYCLWNVWDGGGGGIDIYEIWRH